MTMQPEGLLSKGMKEVLLKRKTVKVTNPHNEALRGEVPRETRKEYMGHELNGPGYDRDDRGDNPDPYMSYDRNIRDASDNNRIAGVDQSLSRCPPGFMWDGNTCVPDESKFGHKPMESCPPGYTMLDGGFCVAEVPLPHGTPNCPQGYNWDGNYCTPNPPPYATWNPGDDVPRKTRNATDDNRLAGVDPRPFRELVGPDDDCEYESWMDNLGRKHCLRRGECPPFQKCDGQKCVYDPTTNKPISDEERKRRMCGEGYYADYDENGQLKCIPWDQPPKQGCPAQYRWERGACRFIFPAPPLSDMTPEQRRKYRMYQGSSMRPPFDYEEPKGRPPGGCPEGEYYTGSFCRTLPWDGSEGICHHGYQWDPVIKDCKWFGPALRDPPLPPQPPPMGCPPRTFWDGTKCAPEMPEYLTQPSQSNCPQGYYWDGDTCRPQDSPDGPQTPSSRCPPGFMWDGNNCVPDVSKYGHQPMESCPPGYKMLDGGFCVADVPTQNGTPSCSPGYHWDGNNCVPDAPQYANYHTSVYN